MNDRSDALRTEETRRALIEQLAHLSDEVAALRGHLDVIPSPVITGRPLESDPSFKELYALLALYDENVFLPALHDLEAAREVSIDLPEPDALLASADWLDEDMSAVIDRVQRVRQQLADQVADMDLEAWRTTFQVDGEEADVYGLVYTIIQHDADLLRTAAYRLHESRLTSREEDLPK